MLQKRTMLNHKQYSFILSSLSNNTLKLRFCICFWGVTSRSLDLTYKSINENIFDVISKYNIETDLYVHNMKIANYSNKHARENIILSDKTNLLNYLNCNNLIYSETKQEDFDNSFNWEGIHTTRFSYQTLQNAIRSLYSVKSVTKMWQNQDIKYDYYIYIRPDLLYINKINIKLIIGNFISSNTLQTPFWHKRSGLNDRIYMGKENEISIIGNRLDYAKEYTNKQKKGYHPEGFMKYIVEKNKIKIIDINLKGKRVRANGKIVKEKFRQKK